MALIRNDLQLLQAGAGVLTLQPLDGQAARVTRIRHLLTTTPQLSAFIDRRRIRTLDLAAPTTPHFADTIGPWRPAPLFQRYFNDLPGMFPIPIASGQQFTIPVIAAADRVIVSYDLYDEADVKASEPNGSDSTEFSFVQVLQNPAMAAWGNVTPMNVQVTPADMPSFPANPVVPAGWQYTLRAIGGIPFMEANAGAIIGRTAAVRGMLGQEEIFGLPGNGFRWLGAAAGAASIWIAVESQLGISSNSLVAATNMALEPHVFDPPIVFAPGQNFQVLANTLTGGAGGAIAAGNIRLMLALTAKRL